MEETVGVVGETVDVVEETVGVVDVVGVVNDGYSREISIYKLRI